MSVPGPSLVQKALAKAIIGRNEESLELYRQGSAALTGMNDLDADGGVDVKAWDIPKLVQLRTQVYKANKKYRKSKRKFDAAVVRSIFLQDLQECQDDLAPMKNTATRLFNAFTNNDNTIATGWDGLSSAVRQKYTGEHWLKLEVAHYVVRTFVEPALKMVFAVGCMFASGVVLWTEFVVLPGMGDLFMDAQEGSLLLYSVCAEASTPPGCFKDGIPPQPWQHPWRVQTEVQWTIWAHLFFICSILHFALVRLKLFSIYEVVPGETDAFSLLFNAYAVCRLAPSIAQNYLNMLQEAHESSAEVADATVFESIFSAMGTIPFTGLTFNEVLPPIILVTFLFTLLSSLLRKVCACPRLDGEAHKTDDIIQAAQGIVSQERRKYVVMAKMSGSANRRRADLSVHGSAHEGANGQAGNQSPFVKGWGRAKGVVHAMQVKAGLKLPDQGDKKAMLGDVELGEAGAHANGNTNGAQPATNGADAAWAKPSATPAAQAGGVFDEDESRAKSCPPQEQTPGKAAAAQGNGAASTPAAEPAKASGKKTPGWAKAGGAAAAAALKAASGKASDPAKGMLGKAGGDPAPAASPIQVMTPDASAKKSTPKTGENPSGGAAGGATPASGSRWKNKLDEMYADIDDI
mmetsp:Transcript_12769/g.31348  ORF Transcript_12769/g.31348 Transcript_12769/m.31348 type:complete len:633 (+) Transcript_12769:37-1935(+)